MQVGISTAQFVVLKWSVNWEALHWGGGAVRMALELLSNGSPKWRCSSVVGLCSDSRDQLTQSPFCLSFSLFFVYYAMKDFLSLLPLIWMVLKLSLNKVVLQQNSLFPLVSAVVSSAARISDFFGMEMGEFSGEYLPPPPVLWWPPSVRGYRLVSGSE